MKYSGRPQLKSDWNKWRLFFTTLVALVDTFVIVVSLAIGYLLNFQGLSFQSFLSHQWKLTLYSIGLFVGLNAMLGVYRQAYTSRLRLQVAAALKAYILGTLIIFATLFLFRNTYYSNGALFTYLVLMPGTFLCGRLLLDGLKRTLIRRNLGLQSAVVVLVDQDVAHFSNDPIPGVDVKSVIDIRVMEDAAALRLIGESPEALGAQCLIYRCSTIEASQLPALMGMRVSGSIVQRLVTTEIEDTMARVRLYNFSGIALSGSPGTATRALYRIAKRVFDIVVSSVLIVMTAPLLTAIALAIFLESRGGVFFRQMRSLSVRSNPVHVLKFRSMQVNGGEMQGSVEPETNLCQEVTLKSPSDPRVTRVGRVIRKYSLDELPQLFNVLTGEMSLIGPRPLPASDFRNMPAGTTIGSLYELRSGVKPGLTGLWQISGRSGLNFQQMVILDLYYAEHQTFLFDLEILLETIPAVISGRGAY